jgi:hypothetical protein
VTLIAGFDGSVDFELFADRELMKFRIGLFQGWDVGWWGSGRIVEESIADPDRTSYGVRIGPGRIAQKDTRMTQQAAAMRLGLY